MVPGKPYPKLSLPTKRPPPKRRRGRRASYLFSRMHRAR